MPTLIYALTDPTTGRIRYIGKTHQDIDRRLKLHLARTSLLRHTHKTLWLRKLIRNGLRPGIVVLEECTTDGANEERHHIALARADGIRLTNSTVGGEGCWTCSDELRRIRSENAKRKRKPHSAETRRRQSVARAGRSPSREQVARTRATMVDRYRLPGWNTSVHPSLLTALRMSRGLTMSDVARHLKVSAVLVRYYEIGKLYPSKTVGRDLESLFGPLKEWKAPANVPECLPTYNQRTDLDAAGIVARYANGESALAIGASFNASRETIARLLRRHGVPLRPAGAQRRPR